MKSKRHEIILSVLAIGTVLSTAIGVTFAYFSTTMSGTPGSVSVTTATVGGVTFDGGTNFTTEEKIEPNWTQDKTFSISVAPSDVDLTVLVKISYTNTMPGLKFSVKSETSESGAKEDLEVLYDAESDNLPTHEMVLVEKTFPASKTGATINYTLTMSFPDTGANQNESQGKVFEGELFAEHKKGGTTLYFNDSNKEGTTEEPKLNP